MNGLDVKHFLNIYGIRQRMQDNGTTNPTPEMKEITRLIVEKLSMLPLAERITIDAGIMKDSKGKIIAEFPRTK